MSSTDKVFAGAIPRLYEQYLVPLLFEPYAADLARRVAALAPGRVLEVASGTGVATRAMAATLPASTTIVAADLNQAMLDQASALTISRDVEWRQADAMDLPFDDASFDAVVCQSSVMFFPDKARALAQFRRLLRPRDSGKLEAATDAGAAMVAQRLGAAKPTGTLQAHVVTIARDAGV